MLDYAPDLAADRVAFALAQIFDLLGDVLAIEPVVGDRHSPHNLGLVLRPGVEIILVAWSVRHRGPSEQLDIMARPAPTRRGDCGTLDILFEHQRLLDELPRRRSDRCE